MTPEQIAALRTALNAIGLIPPNATDADVQNAWVQYQQQNPSGANTVLQQSGIAPAGPSVLTIIGLLGGAVALYLIWRQYQKPKRVASMEYPEPEDYGPQLRRASKALSPLRGFGRHSLSGGCKSRGMGRYAGTGSEKYEFEPELRLEGYRKRKGRR
jgi:hypothetical protein